MNTKSKIDQNNKIKTVKNITCPHCGSKNVNEAGMSDGVGAKKIGTKLPSSTLKQYKCKDCEGSFHKPC